MNPILEALKSLTKKVGKTPVASMLPGGSMVKAGPTIEDIAKMLIYDPNSKKVAPMSPIHKMTGKPEDTQDLAMSIGTMMGGVQPTQDIMKASLARLAPVAGNSGKLIPGEAPTDFIARIKAQKPVAGGGIDEVWNPAKPTLKADYDKALSTGDTATVKRLESDIPESYRKTAPTLVNHNPLLSEAKGIDPNSATLQQQKEILKNMKVGKGEYKAGEVYTQKIMGSDRPIVISKVNPDGSVEGYYTGAISPTEKSFGIGQTSLQPAKWNNPTKELQIPKETIQGTDAIKNTIKQIK